QQGEQRSDSRQLERRREPLLEQRRYRPALAQRKPEITLYRAPDKACELHVEGLVEAEIRAQLRALLLGRVLADHEGHRIAGEVEQPEGDEGNDRHDDDRLQDAAKDEREQGVVPASTRSDAADNIVLHSDDAQSAPERQCAAVTDSTP